MSLKSRQTNRKMTLSLHFLLEASNFYENWCFTSFALPHTVSTFRIIPKYKIPSQNILHSNVSNIYFALPCIYPRDCYDSPVLPSDRCSSFRRPSVSLHHSLTDLLTIHLTICHRIIILADRWQAVRMQLRHFVRLSLHRLSVCREFHPEDPNP